MKLKKIGVATTNVKKINLNELRVRMTQLKKKKPISTDRLHIINWVLNFYIIGLFKLIKSNIYPYL